MLLSAPEASAEVTAPSSDMPEGRGVSSSDCAESCEVSEAMEATLSRRLMPLLAQHSDVAAEAVTSSWLLGSRHVTGCTSASGGRMQLQTPAERCGYSGSQLLERASLVHAVGDS